MGFCTSLETAVVPEDALGSWMST